VIFLVAEPKHGVSKNDFEMTASITGKNDFKIIDRLKQDKAVLFC